MLYERALERLKSKGLNLDINSFLRTFNRISSIGWVESYGSTRLALTNEHIMARRELLKELENIGAKVLFDEAGNIIAEVGSGSRAIAIGSHLDSVPGGGRFDGVFGIIAGLEILRAIVKSSLRLKHKLILVDFNNEEGSRWNPPLLGSALSVGVYTRDFVYSRLDSNGVTFGEALERSGFKSSAENNLSMNPPRFYIEPHIEQGPELYREGYDIGIPQGIVGLRVLELTFKGRQDHASSHISLRRDSVVGLSKAVLRLREYALKNQDKLRITVGYISVDPGKFNVVPALSKITVDIRSYDSQVIDEATKYTIKVAENIGGEENLSVDYRELWTIPRIVFDPEVTSIIEESCRDLGFKCKRMWSWAGHDAQNMSRITKTAMIFVPSVEGISHSKDEYTREEDLVKGLILLAEVVLRLDEI